MLEKKRDIYQQNVNNFNLHFANVNNFQVCENSN